MTTYTGTYFPTADESQGYFSSLLPVINQRPLAMKMLSRSDETAEPDDLISVGKESPIVVAFADNVNEEHQEAVKLGAAFAERAASAQADRKTQPELWLKHYAEAMRHSGWYMGSGDKYTEFTTSNASLTMDSIVLELLGAVAGPNKAAILTIMGLALDRLTGNDPAMKLFERNAQQGTTSEFQIMPCLSSAAGTPVTYILFVKVEVKKTSGGTLFWKWSASNLKISQMGAGLEFNRIIHTRNRDYILDYLDGNTQDYFESLRNLRA